MGIYAGSAEGACRNVPAPIPRSPPHPLATPHSASDPLPGYVVVIALILALAGLATWYTDPHQTGFYAAAGPELRIGDWRGRVVVVCAERCIRVTLTDACACGDRHGQRTLLDLSPAAFRELAPLSRGVTEVRVTSEGPRRAAVTR